MLDDKPLPHDEKIEREVLGCFLTEEDEGIVNRLVYKITDKDFTNPAYRGLFIGVRENVRNGKPCDEVSMSTTHPDALMIASETITTVLFEKRIEQDLLILYKNTSKFEKRFKILEEEINRLHKMQSKFILRK